MLETVQGPTRLEKWTGKSDMRKWVERGKTVNIRVGLEQSYGFPETMVQNELSCLVPLARVPNRQF